MTKRHEITVEDFNEKVEKELASASVQVGSNKTKRKILYFSVLPSDPTHFHYGVHFGYDTIEYSTIKEAIEAYNEL